MILLQWALKIYYCPPTKAEKKVRRKRVVKAGCKFSNCLLKLFEILICLTFHPNPLLRSRIFSTLIVNCLRWPRYIHYFIPFFFHLTVHIVYVQKLNGFKYSCLMIIILGLHCRIRFHCVHYKTSI